MAVLAAGGRHASSADSTLLETGGSWVWVRPSAEGRAELARMADAGQLRVPAADVLPLQELPAAFARSREAHLRANWSFPSRTEVVDPRITSKSSPLAAGGRLSRCRSAQPDWGVRERNNWDGDVSVRRPPSRENLRTGHTGTEPAQVLPESACCGGRAVDVPLSALVLAP